MSIQCIYKHVLGSWYCYICSATLYNVDQTTLLRVMKRILYSVFRLLFHIGWYIFADEKIYRAFHFPGNHVFAFEAVALPMTFLVFDIYLIQGTGSRFIWPRFVLVILRCFSCIDWNIVITVSLYCSQRILAQGSDGTFDTCQRWYTGCERMDRTMSSIFQTTRKDLHDRWIYQQTHF